MRDFLELIERVNMLDASPNISQASYHLAHILLEDAAELMRTRVFLIASNLLMEEGHGTSFNFSRPL